MRKSPHLLTEHAVLCSITAGFVFVNLVGRIVTCRVCKLGFSVFQISVLPLPLGILIAYGILPKFLEVPFLFSYGFLAVVLYFWFAASVSNDMTKFLGIKLLTIPSPVRHHTS